jgi:hypothetical protein
MAEAASKGRGARIRVCLVGGGDAAKRLNEQRFLLVSLQEKKQIK